MVVMNPDSRQLTCGCCTNGCVCWNHQDTPRGLPVNTCDEHKVKSNVEKVKISRESETTVHMVEDGGAVVVLTAVEVNVVRAALDAFSETGAGLYNDDDGQAGGVAKAVRARLG